MVQPAVTIGAVISSHQENDAEGAWHVDVLDNGVHVRMLTAPSPARIAADTAARAVPDPPTLENRVKALEQKAGL